MYLHKLFYFYYCYNLLQINYVNYVSAHQYPVTQPAGGLGGYNPSKKVSRVIVLHTCIHI